MSKGKETLTWHVSVEAGNSVIYLRNPTLRRMEEKQKCSWREVHRVRLRRPLTHAEWFGFNLQSIEETRKGSE